jgi:hypothetical protein
MQQKLLDTFKYVDGNLYWKVDRRVVKAGDLAGHIGKDGYCRIKFEQKYYLAHRIVFMMHYGYMPEFIDHIDGDSRNNRVENLRECTISQNGMNSKASVKNSSGAKGVSWSKAAKKWMVRIWIKKKCKYIGIYEDKELADFVSEEARNKFHGEFARII